MASSERALPGPAGGRATSVCFVVEQHLGHRTYGANLRDAVDARTDVVAEWVEVDYVPNGAWWSGLPLPGAVRGPLGGRHQVRRGLKRSSADVNVFNTQVPAALGGGLARSKPYVAITDVTPLQYDRMAPEYAHRADGKGLVGRYKHHVNRQVFREAAACVAWSTWAAASIVADYDVPAVRVKVIPPGIHLDRWQPGSRTPDGTVRMLFVGGDFRRKGGDLLLDAFAPLPANVELTLVTQSHIPELPERVSVVGDLAPNDDRLRQLYADSDIFVLPSRAETFGIAAIEAAAAGLPAIVSDVGGLRDTVEHRSTGLVVPTGDRRALREALTTLVDDAQLRTRLGLATRERAEQHFDASANTGALLDLIRTARQR